MLSPASPATKRPTRRCCRSGPHQYQVSMVVHGMSKLMMLMMILSSCHCLTSTNMPLPPMTTTQEHIPLAKKAIEYLNASTDPFFAVQTSIDMLKQAGFQELSMIPTNDNDDDNETATSIIKPGGKYYYTRNKSTLVAFAIGQQYSPTHGGFKIIGGHTDSPNLKVKPRSKRSSKNDKAIQIGVECYGGGLWHTWFDRDLGLSGRVFCRRSSRTDNNNNNATISIEQRLIRINRPVLRISNLAIHLQTADERKAFKINKEDHLSPILAMAAQKALTDGGNNNNNNNNDVDDDGQRDDDSANNESSTQQSHDAANDDGWTEYQEPLLLQLLSHELNIPVKDIVDFELNLFDIQGATMGGVHSEFLYSARLDNLASCFMAIQALIDCVSDNNDSNNYLDNDKDISMVVLYDHEEVGSSSAVGAAGPVTKEAVKKISAALNAKGRSVAPYDVYEATIQKSFILSSDQAHALHPNYASKHEKNHQPQMNAGMVIKRNSNQRYATNGATGVLIREIARRASLPPVQEFIVRQDCGCGSTIGPLLSTATGIRAIDMGCPQLSMHSIRETMGVCDLTNGLQLFKAFFVHFRDVDDSLEQ